MPDHTSAENTSVTLIRTAALLLANLMTVIFYTFFHEFGHILTASIFGGNVTDFSINFFNLSAHAGVTGVYTAFQQSLINISGAGLPLFLWLVYLLVLPQQPPLLAGMVRTFSTIFVLSSLLPWVIIPFLFLSGSAPASDDVTKLLINSGIPPLLEALLAAMIIAAGWVIFFKKIGSPRKELKHLLFSEQNPFKQPATGWLFGSLAAVLTVSALLGTFNSANPSKPPPGFQAGPNVSLSQQDNTDREITSFTFEKPQKISIFILVKDIQTPYLDLALVHPDGTSKVLLHGEAYTASLDRAMIDSIPLQPGKYRIVLNSRKSPGSLSVFWKIN